MTKHKYNIDDEVFWTDPDEGRLSGIYKVVDLKDGEEDDPIYVISNDNCGSMTEVFESELS